MIYLDASAVVTLLSGRRHVGDLNEYLRAQPPAPLATSTVGFVETVRTLDRMGSYPRVMEQLERRFTEILLTEEVRQAAAAVPARVRTLDALHVASAQAVGEVLTALVTYDKRMYEVAGDVGLPVAAPGWAPNRDG